MWVWLTSPSWGRSSILRGVGSGVGMVGYELFAFSLLLSSRWKKLEDWIGGLDRVYHLHHKVGLWGFYFILAHPLIYAMKWMPQDADKFFLFTLPFHHRLSVNLGSYAFWLMCFLLVTTALKVFSYDKWKLTHKLMTLVFILTSLHFLLSYRRFNPSSLALVPLLIPMCIGIFGLAYKQVWIPLFFRRIKYVMVGKNWTKNGKN